MTSKKKSPVGKPGYTGNPNGRPSDKLKGMTPPELKQALSKLKRVCPKAIDILIALMENSKGENGEVTLAQGKVAKELITLFVTLDNHAVKRAADLSKLMKELDRKDDEELDGADEALNEEEDQAPATVLHLHVTKD